MKVFISWSGERSRRVGEIFNKYLPCILQNCEPLFSPDIEKGTRWFPEISNQLKEASIGLLCLTRENLKEPWILFESGALSKIVERSHVCPFLLDLDSIDLTGPLAQFQATKNKKEDIYQMMSTVNSCTDNSLPESVLEMRFEKWWPDLEKEIKSIPKPTLGEKKKHIRSDREILEEILTILREERLTKSVEASRVCINLTTEPSINLNQRKMIIKNVKEIIGSETLWTYSVKSGFQFWPRSSPSMDRLEEIRKIPGVRDISKVSA